MSACFLEPRSRRAGEVSSRPPPSPHSPALSHNLPAQLTSFIGRRRELTEVNQLLATARLVTLTGPAGCGKTRLALQVATDLIQAEVPFDKAQDSPFDKAQDRQGSAPLHPGSLAPFPDGVWWVDLAELTDSTLIPHAVASKLGLREFTGAPPADRLSDYLGGKNLLLVFDNCEHVVDACAYLATTLLHTCPKLRIMATSREALGVAGETVWVVPPLAIPDFGLDQTPNTDYAVRSTQSDAVRLFVDRAAAVLPTFSLTRRNAPVVAQICRQLDGLPLAIELAAARVKVLAVQQIAARLDDRFRLLTAGSRTAPPRHRTLQAAIDWSYDLLSEKEQALFRRLSVFAGGFTLEAAEAVCSDQLLVTGKQSPVTSHQRRPEPVEGSSVTTVHCSLFTVYCLPVTDILDLLSHLVDKSLVVAEARGEAARYRLLETVRQYGRDRLQESGEENIIWRRHTSHFLQLAEEAEPHLTGEEQVVWLNRLETERDNLRAALAWSQTEHGSCQVGLRLAAALWRFWEMRGYVVEGRGWLESFTSAMLSTSLDSGTEAADPPARCARAGRLQIAKALFAAGALAYSQSDYATADDRLQESAAIWHELEDKGGLGSALTYLGLVELRQGNYALARSLFDEGRALFQEVADQWGLAFSLNHLGNLASRQGDYAIARSFFEDALALRGEIRDKKLVATLLNNFGEVLRCQGEYRQAAALYNGSLSLTRELGDEVGLAMRFHNLAYVARHQGDSRQAARLLEKCLAIYRERGDKRGIALSLAGLAGVAEADGQPARAARLFGGAAGLLETIGSVMSAADRIEFDRSVAAVRTHLGEPAFAAAWAKGQAMTVQQAIAYALGDEGG